MSKDKVNPTIVIDWAAHTANFDELEYVAKAIYSLYMMRKKTHSIHT